MAKRPNEYHWDKLSRAEQDRYIRILWNDNFSEGAIAKFLHIGKGAVVRRRQSHLTDLKPRDRAVVKSEISLDRFHDLLDLDAMDDMRDRGVIPMGPVGEPEERKRAAPKVPARETSANAPAPPKTPAKEPSLRPKPRRVVELGTVTQRPKLAASEATQCTYRDTSGARCAFEWTNPKTKRCPKHPR